MFTGHACGPQKAATSEYEIGVLVDAELFLDDPLQWYLARLGPCYGSFMSASCEPLPAKVCFEPISVVGWSASTSAAPGLLEVAQARCLTRRTLLPHTVAQPLATGVPAAVRLPSSPSKTFQFGNPVLEADAKCLDSETDTEHAAEQISLCCEGPIRRRQTSSLHRALIWYAQQPCPVNNIKTAVSCAGTI